MAHNTPSLRDRKRPADVLAGLSRSDKWYLGGGNRLVWTPPHPVWLDTLGFWDEAHYYHYRLAPLFTITLLDEHGREIPCRLGGRRWRPDYLEQTCLAADGLSITERKSLHPRDVLTARVALRNASRDVRRLRVVAWSAQEHRPSEQTHFLDEIAFEGAQLRFRLHTTYRDHPVLSLGCTLGMNRAVTSYGVHFSQGSVLQPRWRLTPFFEAMDEGGLGGFPPPSGPVEDGLVYLGLLADVEVPPGSEEALTVGFAAAPERLDAAACLAAALEDENGQAATRAWEAYYERLPELDCSDPYLSMYYYYRWYGLHLFTLAGGEGNVAYPAVCEGPSYFRLPITYSAQCHILETRWMDTPTLGQGGLLNFIHNQRADGSFPGHLYVHSVAKDSFYHANWAFIRHLHFNHPDDAFLRCAYDGLSRYTRYFDEMRDAERSGLYDVQNMYETGQEYMHRYVAVEAHADEHAWGTHFRLKGVDATVYMYEIKRLLAWIADRLGHADAEPWRASAEKTRRAIREAMWDPEAEMFFDVDPATGERTGVKAAVCFYPYFTDITDAEHLPGLKRHLLDPETFWTPFPVPSSSRDDRFFDPRARWKGQRKNCPWNGRVWPMTNSHVAEALGTSAIRFSDELLRAKTAEFITRFVRMMFYDGDPGRPNCFEHYNPFSGKACEYRGVDDYQHSWVNELLIKYLAGLRPHELGVVVDPFPFDVDYVRLADVPVRGRRLSVERRRDAVSAWIDGTRAAEGPLGEPLMLEV